MRMNEFEGKEILATVRSEDFAHAGEEEAIELVFKDITKQADRKILDAGCGRGGSANYVRRHACEVVPFVNNSFESPGTV
jgi:cyclopropane fatty-acyl-phospholipid synthase-like methyltransferase